tara:strand:- start:1032 stop:1688 length:657 start_codon:yes stop_codon:yes gene_type:complete
MSFNNVKVNSLSNPSANVTLSIDNLSNVSISNLSNGQFLKYNGTNWVNDTSSATKEYMYLGEGASQPYSNSGHTSIGNSNHIVRIYDSNPVNTISGASLSYKDDDSNTNWITYITLPAGKYNVTARTKFEFDNENGLVAYNLTTSGTSTSDWLTALAVTGHRNIYEGAASTLQGCFTLSSSTDVYFRIDDYDGAETVSNQGNTPAENTFLYIEKLNYS